MAKESPSLFKVIAQRVPGFNGRIDEENAAVRLLADTPPNSLYEQGATDAALRVYASATANYIFAELVSPPAIGPSASVRALSAEPSRPDSRLRRGRKHADRLLKQLYTTSVPEIPQTRTALPESPVDKMDWMATAAARNTGPSIDQIGIYFTAYGLVEATLLKHKDDPVAAAGALTHLSGLLCSLRPTEIYGKLMGGKTEVVGKILSSFASSLLSSPPIARGQP